MSIVSATVVVGIIGLFIGISLVAAGKKFHVETDPREAAVREHLPGNNCGACGYAGCDAVTSAIVKGEAAVNACPVCSADAITAIGDVMGVKATAAARRVAFVHCAGDCIHSPIRNNYIGIADCRAASSSNVFARTCDYGCLGYGSCVKVCNYDAISIKNGVAQVDTTRCAGCGMCASVCPRHLIEILPAGHTMAIQCASRERGAAMRKVCTAGCLGCSLCVRQCDNNAVSVEENLAQIDPSRCIGCGMCAEKCPAKVIRYIL